jgi:hypothetical protein
MYYDVIQQFTKTLRNLDGILEKAIRHAEAKKFDPNNFCTARLAPDMFPLTKQVQIASDVAKAMPAMLTGKEPPKFEDNETTMEQLRERVRKTLAHLETYRADDFAKVTDKTAVKVPYPQGKSMHAADWVFARSVPNLFFHVSMTYALLRAGGVDVGKGDFLGPQNLF